ncbi:membrane indolylacetylinositol arabinosyltransferase embC [Mycobacterium tuberculosis]|nr:membrane indolylacetylinositol arabinosyltransferase embC [Mycobacterium tuberculosis]
MLVVRNVPLVTAPLSQVLGPTCQRLTFTAQRCTGVLSIGSLHQSDEFGGDPIGVRGECQPLTGRAEHLTQRGGDQRDITHHKHQVVVGPLQQQPAIDGLRRLLGHR